MNRFYLVNILAISILFASVIAKPFELESILQNFPEKHRALFIKHYLKLGYELSGGDKRLPLEFPDLPAEFSIALYNYARNENSIDDDDLVNLLENWICFPNGECIDIDDVGVHPKLQPKN